MFGNISSAGDAHLEHRPFPHTSLRCSHVLMSLCVCMITIVPTRAEADDDSPNDPGATALVLRATGDPDTRILSAHREDLRYLNDSILLVKYLDANGSPAAVAAKSDGSLLADQGVALRRADVERRFELFGALDEELWDLMVATPADVRIPVGIWLRSYQPPARREDLLADPFLAQMKKAEHDASIASSANALLRDWAEISTASLRIEKDVPVAFGELSYDELVSIADHPAIAQIYWDKVPVPQWTTYVATVKADMTGYTGIGEKICIIEGHEPNTPNTLTINGRFCPGLGITDDHSRQVTGVVRSGIFPFGTGRDATVELADFGLCNFTNANPGIAWCATRGATVWNWSHSCSTLDNRVFDFHAKNWPYPLIVAASGNQFKGGPESCINNCTSGRLPVTCSSYNALIVGGANDCGTGSRFDDRIFCDARDLNTDNRELPHLVAPAYNITVEGSLTSGTSFAAPMLTGVAAQLQQRAALLDSWPEAARSIIMAGADEDVDGVRFSRHDAIDDRDGAGLLNAETSSGIAALYTAPGAAPSPKGWFGGTLASVNVPVNGWYGPFRSFHNVAGGRLRFVLSWDSTATCTNPSLDTGSCASDQMDADLDLYVFRDLDGALMGSSTTTNDSYEFVEFPTTAGHSYSAWLLVRSWTNPVTYIGVAWRQGVFSL